MTVSLCITLESRITWTSGAFTPGGGKSKDLIVLKIILDKAPQWRWLISCALCLRMLSFWKTNQSNMINGSDGSAFHPFLTKEERLNLFTPDFCRSRDHSHSHADAFIQRAIPQMS
ncbi:Lysosome membrane protein 2 [Anabarilius grahami]|uniref:Lysosome membrane protein 2 n=1 Tax=Anabarilius grahami TaxID=495550 RepID=A0A3N0Y6U7_ANAGA|nr:Lysosome membrane protein 2 [Anabarilius grahami]